MHFIPYVSVSPSPKCKVIQHLQLGVCSRECLANIIEGLWWLARQPPNGDTQGHLQQSIGEVLWYVLKSFGARRFLIADKLLDILRRPCASVLAGPIKISRAMPDTQKGCALVSLGSESSDFQPDFHPSIRAIYTFEVYCNTCKDPLRAFAPDFCLPAEFAHARRRLRLHRVRRLIVCATCGRRFNYLWREFALKQSVELHRVISLVSLWLNALRWKNSDLRSKGWSGGAGPGEPGSNLR